MSELIIPDDLAAFILEKIDSVAHLEALILLRDNPEKDWTVDALAKRLYITYPYAGEIVSQLCAEELLEGNQDSPPRYRYHPSSKELAELADRLAYFYSKHLVPVTNLIHSKPKLRVQKFADAFKLRKKEE